MIFRIQKFLFALLLAMTPVHNAFTEIGEITVDVNGTVPAPKAPRDDSTLWLKTGTRISALLIDSKGRRTGVDPTTFKILKEIPGSDCEVDFVTNPYTGEEHSEARERMTLIPAAKGTYKLLLKGLQTGPFDIAANSLSREGSSQPSKDLEGMISEGEEKTIRLSYDPAPNAQMSLIEVPGQPLK